MSKRNLTTSILGDAGAAEATVVPNLESLNTGTDAYVTSISDTSEFNVFQQLKIYDNYWETLFAKHIVTSGAQAQGTYGVISNVNIQGNTEGWVRADHMVLEVPIEFQYLYDYNAMQGESFPTRAGGAIPTLANIQVGDVEFDKVYVGSNAANPWQLAADTAEYWQAQNSPNFIYTAATLPLFAHSWVGCIDVFNRLRLLVGNNGQQIQKQIETEPIGLKYNISKARYGPVVEKCINEWGLQQVPGAFRRDTLYSATRNAQCGPSLTRTYNDWNELYSRSAGYAQMYNNDNARSYFRMLSDCSLNNNYTTAELIAPTLADVASKVRHMKVTKRRRLTLPLQCIMPLFRGSKFLPPDFRFKFEIETNVGKIIAQKLQLFAARSHETANGMADPALSVASLAVAADGSGINLQYPYHILRQPVQAAISAMWLQKPFLFNYETIQTTEVIPSVGSNFINFAISISTQRPTVLDIMLFPLNTTANYLIPTSTTPSANNTQLRIKDTPHLFGQLGVVSNADGINPQKGPMVWTNLEVLLSGRTAYRFVNNDVEIRGRGIDSMRPHEFFVQLFEEQSFRSTATEYNAKSHVERNTSSNPYTTNHYASNSILRLILQPGGWADRGIISSRQGATTITLNINFASTFSGEDRFVVFRTNPEQLVFDSDKNVTIIQWPAIKSNMGYLIPNITAAP